MKLLAQNTSQEAPTAIFDAERAALDRRGMYVLGAWAVSNVGASGARYFATTGSEKYFHQMNVGWGAVNLALAGVSFLGSSRAPSSDRAATTKAQLRTENIYLLNTGLDAAYIMGGFYLKERARTRPTQRRQDQLKGYGQSLLLQGGFLLAFDGVMFAAHHSHATQRLYPLLSNLRFGPGTVALVF
ncbi:DUF6992 family protein [Hymenobacter roseosalivarius]|uniref:DUF6992 family protein n=1 Tax=Hymenobacter roseosalivarius TaxID=89967 RepID=UPI000A00FDBF|nr:hypothetical protein [Hymenobacter roseosalivarius]